MFKPAVGISGHGARTVVNKQENRGIEQNGEQDREQDAGLFFGEQSDCHLFVKNVECVVQEHDREKEDQRDQQQDGCNDRISPVQPEGRQPVACDAKAEHES